MFKNFRYNQFKFTTSHQELRDAEILKFGIFILDINSQNEAIWRSVSKFITIPITKKFPFSKRLTADFW